MLWLHRPDVPSPDSQTEWHGSSIAQTGPFPNYAKNPDWMSRTTASMGSPEAMRPPSHGAAMAKSSARLSPTTQARPTTSSDVRALVRNTSAPALATSADPADDEGDHVEPGQLTVRGGDPGPAAHGDGVERGEQLGAQPGPQLAAGGLGPYHPFQRGEGVGGGLVASSAWSEPSHSLARVARR